MKPVNKPEEFKVGTMFWGIVNGHLFEIQEIYQTQLSASNGRLYYSNKMAIIRDRTTGGMFKANLLRLSYGLFQILK